MDIVLQLYYICVTMKTKPISIRFDENDLVLAQNLSGIKKPQKLVDLLIHEYVKHLKGSLIELPKDYMNFKNIGILIPSGKIEKIDYKKSNQDQIAEYEKELATLGTSGVAILRKKFLLKQIQLLKS